jgi:hypothetical protein
MKNTKKALVFIGLMMLPLPLVPFYCNDWFYVVKCFVVCMPLFIVSLMRLYKEKINPYTVTLFSYVVLFVNIFLVSILEFEQHHYFNAIALLMTCLTLNLPNQNNVFEEGTDVYLYNTDYYWLSFQFIVLSTLYLQLFLLAFITFLLSFFLTFLYKNTKKWGFFPSTSLSFMMSFAQFRYIFGIEMNQLHTNPALIEALGFFNMIVGAALVIKRIYDYKNSKKTQGHIA